MTGAVIAFASVGKLEVLQSWIWRAHTKVIYESRTSTWGSPRFFYSPVKIQAEGQKFRAEFEGIVNVSPKIIDGETPFESFKGD